jgi:hypothetical protein
MIRWPILQYFFNFNSNLNDKLSMLNFLQLTKLNSAKKICSFDFRLTHSDLLQFNTL